MRRALLRYILGTALLLVLVAAGVHFFLRGDEGEVARATPSPAPTSTSVLPRGPSRPVVVFVLGTDGRLAAIKSEIPASGDAGTVAAEALALTLDPGKLPDLTPGTPPPLSAVPPGIQVSAIFFDGHGLATVDLSHLPAALSGSGAEAEANCLWAIVDTLAYNLPVEARRVRVLADGHEASSAGEHVAIDAALEPRRDLVEGEIPAVVSTEAERPAELPADAD